MTMNIDAVLPDMANAMQSVIGEQGGKVAGYALKILEQQKESLAELTQALADGDLTQEEFEQELQREMKIVETELLALQVCSKALIAKAVQEATAMLVRLVL